MSKFGVEIVSFTTYFPLGDTSITREVVKGNDITDLARKTKERVDTIKRASERNLAYFDHITTTTQRVLRTDDALILGSDIENENWDQDIHDMWQHCIIWETFSDAVDQEIMTRIQENGEIL